MDAEVVVAGAGPVGSALTLQLRRGGVRTVLLDKATFPRDKPCGEGLLPSGVAVLRSVGVDLGELGFPSLDGVRYRVPGRGWARGRFAGAAFGVRRLRLDALLAAAAEATTGVGVHDLRPVSGGWRLDTDRGPVTAPIVVAADGVRSSIRRRLGWDGGATASRRFGLVGHLRAAGHRRHEIVVTLLGEVETYLAPAGVDELLLAVLGERGRLRLPRASVADSYRAFVERAHPDLAGCEVLHAVQGAGPFGVRPRRVAGGGVFLCGDAAGFLDPLTGDAMAAGLVQSAVLAALLIRDPRTAAPAYRRYCAG
ncbi:MAG: FAD-dependent monooxygenase, partial [Candidatus Dormiibacterota bacterium]